MNLLGVPWQVHVTVVPVHDGVSTTVTTVPTDVLAALPPIVMTPGSVTLPLVTLP